ncbi:MAG: hypothetical protein LAO24_04815 [Acidobacteriia bacterium]|nr:hypothetical protein [Terriglobia bacterium]
MRVLLIRPEDGLPAGPWAASRWDRVIDLGRAGAESYERAADRLGTGVALLDDLRDGFKEIYRVRELLGIGLGRLKDRFGLDWWELTAILVHLQLETVILLQKFADTVDARDEVHVSGPGFHAEALRLMLGSRVRVFPPQGGRGKRRAGHYFRVLKKFPAGQLLEIFWDKYDSGYQLRGLMSSRRKPQDAPLVLLPTAYGNVSRTGMAYAAAVPEARFLLVATRRSGWVENPPANVSTAWLRSYASVRVAAREAEYKDLMARWELLRKEIEGVPEFRVLSRLGCFSSFSDRFGRGLEIRDAWRNVLDTEPIKAVICADDSNPYTHIPLLLARERRLPTISCHHGALDGRYMFKRCHADVILAKGRMEQDYLESVCGVPASRVEVGAPTFIKERKPETSQKKKPFIVLFSEPYEAMGGRSADVYQDILPGLADLALSEGRQLVVKLHPAESASERSNIIRQTLRPDQRRVVRVVSGPLQSDLLDNTWFGITILSTVTVECALRGIPCFLCKWLESSPYGYVDQFTRFGIGIRLDQPGEIKQIPPMLQGRKPDAATAANCWSPIENERLRVLLGIGRREQTPLPSRADTLGKS